MLKDNEHIYYVCSGEGFIPIYPDDDKVAILIKAYINKSAYDAYIKCIIEESDGKIWSCWNNKLKTQHYIELKVNSIRLKYWYWKALKI